MKTETYIYLDSFCIDQYSYAPHLHCLCFLINVARYGGSKVVAQGNLKELQDLHYKHWKDLDYGIKVGVVGGAIILIAAHMIGVCITNQIDMDITKVDYDVGIMEHVRCFVGCKYSQGECVIKLV